MESISWGLRMNVGFYMTFKRDPQHYVMADLLVASIKEVMPGVSITHFTNPTSPAATGVDAVERTMHGQILERRLECYAARQGDWLLLDTDIIVTKDVRHVFEDQEFQLAVADREWSKVKDHYKYTKEMTYNTGVIFSRDPAVYQRALEIWRGYPSGKQSHWWSEQWAFAEAVHSGQFRVKVLPGMIYNRPPHTHDEDVSDAAILHYKGPIRKAWMLERQRQSTCA